MTEARVQVDRDGDGRWMSQYNRQLSDTKEKEPEVIFIGDTIIQELQQRRIWLDLFESLHSLNLGIGYDTTQNVLWRIDNGVLDCVNPKVVVLHVGTHNVNDTPDEIADGILKIVEKIRDKLPASFIVVMEILPRGQYPNRLRVQNETVNKILQKKLQGHKIELVPVDHTIVQADGSISHHDMLDYMRPTDTCYRKIMEPIHSIILENLFQEH